VSSSTGWTRVGFLASFARPFLGAQAFLLGGRPRVPRSTFFWSLVLPHSPVRNLTVHIWKHPMSWRCKDRVSATSISQEGKSVVYRKDDGMKDDEQNVLASWLGTSMISEEHGSDTPLPLSTSSSSSSSSEPWPMRFLAKVINLRMWSRPGTG
jgi:hypothetical protein